MSDANTDTDFGSWIGRKVTDRDGDKLGTIESVYVDDDSGRPEWLAIKTGHFGHKVSFAPIAGSTAAGKDLRLPYDKEHVKSAPNMDPEGHLDPEDEALLYRHYGREDYDRTDTTGDTGDTGDDQGDDRTTAEQPAAAGAAGAAGTSAGPELRGPAAEGDSGIDQAAVHEQARQGGGRVRLRRYMVTEYVDVGEVQREEVEVVEEDDGPRR